MHDNKQLVNGEYLHPNTNGFIWKKLCMNIVNARACFIMLEFK